MWPFSGGFGAILRQDPDRFGMVEIRDFETADMAVQASLARHLDNLTSHTNSVVGAIM